jgi:hypothetical protein
MNSERVAAYLFVRNDFFVEWAFCGKFGLLQLAIVPFVLDH